MPLNQFSEIKFSLGLMTLKLKLVQLVVLEEFAVSLFLEILIYLKIGNFMRGGSFKM